MSTPSSLQEVAPAPTHRAPPKADTEGATNTTNKEAKGRPAKKSGSARPLASQFDFEAWLKEQWHWRHVKTTQILCAMFVVIYTFGGFPGASQLGDAENGWIVDPNNPQNTARGIIVTPDGSERSVVCTSTFQLICLAIARVTAFYMYPCLVLIYLSKLRATTNLIAQTPLGMFVCDDWHDLHIYCGWSIFINSILHTIFHVIRYADQGNIELLVTNRSGLSGVVIFIALLLVCMPMMFVSIKQRIKYEIRKGLHYFFYVFAIALAFHSPASAWPNGGWAPYIFGILILWYFLDSTYCTVMLTEKIDTTVFDVLPSGVQMTMAVSKRYNTGFNGGYCYICLPWVDKTQWHAFSLFEHPTKPHLKQVFILKTGDWTSAVHKQLERNTVRPVWIQGPYLSPYNRSVDYDNQIMIASGIGITPALSVIRAQKETRRTNLIWCVRCPALLEFFLERAYLDHSGWNLVFYTGKKPLMSSRIEQLTSTNVQVIQGRPDLPKVIRNIIYGIESGKGSPQQYIPDQKAMVTDAILSTLEDLNQIGDLAKEEKFAVLSDTAMEYGFQLTNALYDFDGLFTKEELGEMQSNGAYNEDAEDWSDSDDDGFRPVGRSSISKAQVIERLEGMVSQRGAAGKISWNRQPSSGLINTSGYDGTKRPHSRILRRSRSSEIRSIIGLGNSSHHSRPMGGFRNAAPALDRSAGASIQPREEKNGQEQEQEPLMSESFVERQTARNVLVQEAIEIGFKPWEDNDEAEDYVKRLSEDHLATWGLLYCGGSKVIEDKLKVASECYNIQLHSENFSW